MVQPKGLVGLLGFKPRELKGAYSQGVMPLPLAGGLREVCPRLTWGKEGRILLGLPGLSYTHHPCWRAPPPPTGAPQGEAPEQVTSFAAKAAAGKLGRVARMQGAVVVVKRASMCSLHWLRGKAEVRVTCPVDPPLPLRRASLG